MKKNSTNSKGYILYYVLIVAGLFAVLASSILMGTLRDLEISDQEINALKARFAADAGVECITYWQTSYDPRPLDSTNPNAETIHCDTLLTPASLTSPGPVGGPECDEYEGTIRIGPFDYENDQCADIELNIVEHPATNMVCTTKVLVHGYSDCSASPKTQRSLWHEI